MTRTPPRIPSRTTTRSSTVGWFRRSLATGLGCIVFGVGALHAAPAPAAQKPSVTVYVTRLGSGTLGCGDSLSSIRRVVDQATIRNAITALTRETELGDEFTNPLTFMTLDRVDLKSGVASIWLRGSYGGACDEPRVPAQVIATASQFRTVKSVRVYVNGRRVASSPATQKTFANGGSGSAAANSPGGPLGTITGRLVYPSDSLPSDFEICLEKINAGAQSSFACSNDQQVRDQNLAVIDLAKGTFRFRAEPGTYYVSARAEGSEEVFATEFTRCGIDVSCTSHRALTFTVRSGQTTANVVCCDFWSSRADQRAT